MNFCPSCGYDLRKAEALRLDECTACKEALDQIIYRWTPEWDEKLRYALEQKSPRKVSKDWNIPAYVIYARAKHLNITTTRTFHGTSRPRIILDSSVGTEYTQGSTMAELAAKWGCSTTHVYKYLRQAGVPRRPQGTRFIFDETVKIDYEAGISVDKLVAKWGCCPALIYQYLRSIGVTIRSKGRGVGNYDKEARKRWPAILAQFDAGDTLEAIGKQFGYTRERIRQIAALSGRPARRVTNAPLAAQKAERLKIQIAEAKVQAKARRIERASVDAEQAAKLWAEGRTYAEIMAVMSYSWFKLLGRLRVWRTHFPERFPKRPGLYGPRSSGEPYVGQPKQPVQRLHKRLITLLKRHQTALIQNEEMLRAAAIWNECPTLKALGERLGLSRTVVRGRLDQRWRKIAPELFPKRWKRSKYDNVPIEQFLAEYDNGTTLAALGRQFDLSKGQVWTLAKKHGRTRYGRHPARSRTQSPQPPSPASAA